MKTLVIHPKDETTDFLSAIYKDKDYTVITDDFSNLAFHIEAHDRIMMMGHGTPQGLLNPLNNYNSFVINAAYVSLLRTKECVCIWCNADKFVKANLMKCFHTGMIISEWNEAAMFLDLEDFTDADIEESNRLFTESIANHIDEENGLKMIKESYSTSTNKVIEYNMSRIYNNK